MTQEEFEKKMTDKGYKVQKHDIGTVEALDKNGNGYCMSAPGAISKVENHLPTFVWVSEKDLV